MLILKTAGLTITTLLVFTAVALAQDGGRFDASISYTGVFSKTSTAALGTVSLKPTTSGGVLGTFRYHFNPKHGVEVNVGHTSNSQVYSIPPDTFRVNTGITEFTGAYVFSPFHGHRIAPFVFGGGGVLRFNPSGQYIDGFLSSFGATRERDLTVLYGGGADCRLWKALALRVQYRGLIFKAPDFGQSRLFTGVMGHMAEPSAGIVFKF